MKISKYNRKKKPCVTDSKYSFTSCVIQHIVYATNCTVRIEMVSLYLNLIISSFIQYQNELKTFDNYNECTDLEKVDKHLTFWNNLLSNKFTRLEKLIHLFTFSTLHRFSS